MNDQNHNQDHNTSREDLREENDIQSQIHDLAKVEMVRASHENSAFSLTSALDALQPSDRQSISLSEAHPAQNSAYLVLPLGKVGTDYGTRARQDSIMQEMGNDDILSYLDKNPSEAASIIWTLNLDATPIYAIQPQGAFASEAYAQLRKFLREQAEEGVERVSIPGVVIGKVMLMSGQTVPVIRPELRCMSSWTTAALAEAVNGKPPPESASAEKKSAYAEKREALINFLERLYNQFYNLGITPKERAMNYVGSNVANANNILEKALKKNLTFHSMEVEPSVICRPGSDCWVVKLLFFDSENVLRAKTVYQFTVDVSDVCPVMVGPVRSWSMA